MILSISIENWQSFRDRVTFSMVASKERQHGERLSRLGKYQTRVLPIAAIYGGNASGKTNFFRALSFVRGLVVRGTQPDSLIAVEPFLLDDETVHRPSRFCCEILVDEVIYEFSFAVTHKQVLEERLTAITSTSERVLYSRVNGEAQFDRSLAQDSLVQFAFRGTRDNQLFLTNAVSQRVDTFRPIYEWFRDTLVLVGPDSRFEPFELFLEEGHPLYSTMNHLLGQLDTGIVRLAGEEVPFDQLPLPEELRLRLQDELKEGMTFRLRTEPVSDRYVVTRRNGQLLARKLVAYHLQSDGNMARFELRHESDGSRRIIDLLPAFLELSQQDSSKVYLIDEIDRSLHTLLTRRLLEVYLAGCSARSRKQLLFTTHDLLLLDQHLLRRDEMWVTERDGGGASSLFSFSDYSDVRYDKDIRKSYLQGRLGGLPRVASEGVISSSFLARKTAGDD